MKIGTDNIHLTYCTNIHPGESWSDVFANLQQYIPVLKLRLSPENPFGIGLRLANIAAKELLEKDNLAQFQSWLTAQNLYVFTLNGFPYGEFHHQVVKDAVYSPDWSKLERLNYTINLAKILAALLPQGIDGGISTLPISYKPWWKGEVSAENHIFDSSCLHLASLTAELINLRQQTGKFIHLDIEPEPDGLLENTAEVIDFFTNWLLPVSGAILAESLSISPKLAEAQLLEHIRICYDTCHFAVEYEDPATVFALFQECGIKIGKIQLSAAIKVALPANREVLLSRLRPFAESTYLHQVIERYPDGSLHHYPDLVTALPYLEQSKAQEWRTHFHVPIFIHDYQVLQSTQDDIVAVLQLLQANPVCQHLEIETYTWDVLPQEMKIDLLASIQREYEWVLQTGLAIQPQLASIS
ncbi:metabolite traffic protein EboE [Chlorogloea sp. CCALA 695]|uniref:metabolite traffic protein EboE n=1 Tax=Chlorogloea sp. CCALA 695 TaxID=2107693 RepID=UPI000D05E384|nr:metabolite traffic protein EboE [Chlorogloea sp. CCALA 695]PSB31056.1 xylose isomerase [Chlorogloea sp. CCALA 695]